MVDLVHFAESPKIRHTVYNFRGGTGGCPGTVPPDKVGVCTKTVRANKKFGCLLLIKGHIQFTTSSVLGRQVPRLDHDETFNRRESVLS